jgi:ribonuclease HI
LSTHAFIDKFVSELGETTTVRTRERQLGHPATRWILLTGNLAKINVDAAVSKNSGQASMAAIARDSEGNFITVSTVVSYGITEPETMEAMACREGLLLATGALLSKVRVASDYSSVVRSIHEGSMGVYGHIVQEIRLRENTISAVGVCS